MSLLRPPLGPHGRLERARRSAERSLFALTHAVLVGDLPGEWRIAVHFTKTGVPPDVGPRNFRVAVGGPTGVSFPVVAADAGTDVVTITVDTTGWPDARRNTAVVEVELVDVPDVDPLAVRVSIPVAQDVDLADVEPPTASAAPSTPDLDYLNKDYESFRGFLLGQMATQAPEWRERHVPDLGVMLIELMAYAADYLSYYQDAAATEAYLFTARRRDSVASHARLVDYAIGQGCNARVWVAIRVTGGPVTVARGAAFLTAMPVPADHRGLGVSGEQLDARGAGARVFEAMEDRVLHPHHDRIQLYDWGISTFTVEQGATRVALLGAWPRLEAGEVLLLGRIAGASSDELHAVRLIGAPYVTVDPATGDAITIVTFGVADAMPWDLAVSPDGREVTAFAIGNVVLADHGRTQGRGTIEVETNGRATIETGQLTWAQAWTPGPLGSAAGSLSQDPRATLPQLWLSQEVEGRSERLPWQTRRDLLSSAAWARNVAVGLVEDGVAGIRFGDGVNGMRPAVGARFTATWRVGNGTAGNIGKDTLRYYVDDGKFGGTGRIASITNPLAASGGLDEESIPAARLAAPQAFRGQMRCVTADDWRERVQSYPGVLAAVARWTWTGSWTTAAIYVQQKGGAPMPDDFRAGLADYLAPFALLGRDVELRDPHEVPLDVALTVYVDPLAVRSAVSAELASVFGSGYLPDGTRAYFHPDNFTFGQPVYVSPVVATAMGVTSVTRVDVTRFGRFGHPRNFTDAGAIPMGPVQIARVSNDPLSPSSGRIVFDVVGGR